MSYTTPLNLNDYHVHHPELWNRLWEKHLITQQSYAIANAGKPSRRRDKINFMVNKVYEKFLTEMINGEIK